MTSSEINPERAFVARLEKLVGFPLSIKNDTKIAELIKRANVAGFNLDKLEKDFYLSAILHYLAKALPEITFKGGTCLNKIYFPYFRLSEDLDFMMNTENPLVDSNGKRQAFAYKMRDAMKHIADILGRKLNADHLQHKKAQGNKHLKKKEYTYLKYLFTYQSIFLEEKQTIKIELTYTGKQHYPAKQGKIQAIFVDELLNEPIFPEQTIRCYALEEMMAEKIRASLTRRKPAIRDFFDLRYVKSQGVELTQLKPIVAEKMKEGEGGYTIDGGYEILKNQISTDLEPVLGDDFEAFNFDEIYNFILSFK